MSDRNKNKYYSSSQDYNSPSQQLTQQSVHHSPRARPCEPRLLCTDFNSQPQPTHTIPETHNNADDIMSQPPETPPDQINNDDFNQLNPFIFHSNQIQNELQRAEYWKIKRNKVKIISN